MKKKMLTIILGLFCTLCFSQDQYYKSTLIDAQGEKTQGYISNLFDAKYVKFKKSTNSTPITYAPTQIRGFVLEGNIFESKIVRFFSYKYESSYLGVTGEAPASLTIDTAIGQKTDTLFVQKIVSGAVDLYKLRYNNNAQYLFVGKNNILRELPRQYFTTAMNNSAKTDISAMALRKYSSLNYITYEHKTYLDTLALVCNDSLFIKNLKPFNYSEKKFISTIGAYNQSMGTPNGGIVKQNIPKQFFYGLSIGKIAWLRDENFKYEYTTYSTAVKGFILMPLSGINRFASAKLGINYFVYGNDSRSMTIVGASLGIRYAAISGAVRPYGEFSLSISRQFLNNVGFSTLAPSILEVGVMIPVKSFYVTVGTNFSPFQYTVQNGYQLVAWHAGIMF
jgi:hypothetical protein